MLRNYESARCCNNGRLIISNQNLETMSDTERIEMIVQGDDMDLDVSFLVLISQGLLLNFSI